MPYILFSICGLSLFLTAILGGFVFKIPKGLALRIVFAVALLLIVGTVAKSYLDATTFQAAAKGLGIGASATLAAAALGLALASETVALAISCAVSGVLLLASKGELDATALGAMAGAGIVGGMLATRASNLGSIAIGAVAMAHLLSDFKNANSAEAMIAPVAIGSATVVSVLGLLLAKSKPVSKFQAPAMLGLVALATAALGKTCFPTGNDWLGLLAIPIGVGAVYWMDAADANHPKFKLALAGVLWIGMATIAFGVARNAGIGLTLVTGVGLLIALRRDRPILSATLLLGLSLNRALRFEHSTIGESLDLGQFYVLIAFLMGVFLPLLPGEWIKTNRLVKAWAASGSTAIWGVICLSAPALLALFLAPKGLLGFVSGLGLSGMVGALDSEPDLSALALAGATGGIAILGYGAVEKLGDLTRDEKIHWFLISAVALFATAAALAGLGMLGKRGQGAKA
jgi:hypothetical protein